MKRAGSESSQESLSLPPPSPAPDHMPLDHLGFGSFPGLSSPTDSSMLVSGSTDPMLSMPAASPGSGAGPGDLTLLPTVLGSPPLLVSPVSRPAPLTHRFILL